MTEAQADYCGRVIDHLCSDDYGWLHHGDCIGADAQMHKIAKDRGLKVALHPPVFETKRAFCDADMVYEKARYIIRNRAIVDATLGLLACPKSSEEKLRSGTWSTIRYAMDRRKPVLIVFPDGTSRAVK